MMHQAVRYPRPFAGRPPAGSRGACRGEFWSRGHCDRITGSFPPHPVTRGVEPWTIRDGWLNRDSSSSTECTASPAGLGPAERTADRVQEAPRMSLRGRTIDPTAVARLLHRPRCPLDMGDTRRPSTRREWHPMVRRRERFYWRRSLRGRRGERQQLPHPTNFREPTPETCESRFLPEAWGEVAADARLVGRAGAPSSRTSRRRTIGCHSRRVDGRRVSPMSSGHRGR